MGVPDITIYNNFNINHLSIMMQLIFCSLLPLPIISMTLKQSHMTLRNKHHICTIIQHETIH